MRTSVRGMTWIAILVPVLAATAAAGERLDEIIVAPDGSGDVATIQEAIDLVAPGGIVRLEDGVFSGEGNYNLDFDGKALTLISLSMDAESCIIDCGEVPGDRTGGGGRMTGPREPRGGGRTTGPREPRYGDRSGFLFMSGEGAGSIVNRITVRNGTAFYGGGVYIYGSSPVFQSCRFTANIAYEEGAALWIGGGAMPQFHDCLFDQNYSDTFGGVATIYDPGSHPLFDHCRFEGNAAYWAGVFDLFDGPNLSAVSSVFYDNVATSQGGAIADWDGGLTMLDRNTFSENDADEGGHIYFGPDADLSAEECIFAHAVQGAAFTIEYRMRDLNIEFTCCDAADNTGGDWEGDFAVYEGVDGNFSAPPQFCGQIGNGNLELQSDSPCAPDNNDCGVLIGALPVGCDESAAEATSWSGLKVRF